MMFLLTAIPWIFVAFFPPHCFVMEMRKGILSFCKSYIMLCYVNIITAMFLQQYGTSLLYILILSCISISGDANWN